MQPSFLQFHTTPDLSLWTVYRNPLFLFPLRERGGLSKIFLQGWSERKCLVRRLDVIDKSADDMQFHNFYLERADCQLVLILEKNNVLNMHATHSLTWLSLSPSPSREQTVTYVLLLLLGVSCLVA